MRFSGQIASFYPSTAPLELRLPQSIYDESSPSGPTSTGPGLSAPAPMGDLDSDFGAVDSTALLPGRPLRAARGPIGIVRRPPATPSWVRTDKLLSLQGCQCAQSGFDLSFSNPLVTGALVLAGLWFISKKL